MVTDPAGNVRSHTFHVWFQCGFSTLPQAFTFHLDFFQDQNVIHLGYIIQPHTERHRPTGTHTHPLLSEYKNLTFCLCSIMHIDFTKHNVDKYLLLLYEANLVLLCVFWKTKESEVEDRGLKGRERGLSFQN